MAYSTLQSSCHSTVFSDITYLCYPSLLISLKMKFLFLFLIVFVMFVWCLWGKWKMVFSSPLKAKNHNFTFIKVIGFVGWWIGRSSCNSGECEDIKNKQYVFDPYKKSNSSMPFKLKRMSHCCQLGQSSFPAWTF